MDLFFTNNSDADEYVVFLANISGSLEQSFDECKNSFQHIVDRTHNKKCYMIWVEPGHYTSGKKLLDRIKKLINITPWRQSLQNGPLEYDYHWFHPFQKRKLPCRVLLQVYNRVQR